MGGGSQNRNRGSMGGGPVLPPDDGARLRRAGLVFGIIALAAVLALLAWYATKGSAPDGPVPILEADGTPYKLHPDEPGGREVKNQDKMVYGALSGTEGPQVEHLLDPPEEPMDRGALEDMFGLPEEPEQQQAAQAQMEEFANQPAGQPIVVEEKAEMPEAPPIEPEPEAKPEPKAEPKPEPKAEPKPAPSIANSWRLQLGAFGSQAKAESVWASKAKSSTSLYGKFSPQIVKGTSGGKSIWRLRFGPFADRAAAENHCTKVKAAKGDCLPVAPGK